MEQGNEIIVSLRGINKSYYHAGKSLQVLKDVSLSIYKGCIFGVIGESGAGKSTLIRCINLLERPDSGSVIVNGSELTKQTPEQLRKARQKIGMIFQNFNLLSNKTVYHNIALPLYLAGAKEADVKAKMTPLIELVGLKGKENYYPQQLSGGQKQRVAIARALVSEPDVLLCDEATSALDPETTDAILNLLQEVNRTRRVTIIMITHQPDILKKVCDRVALINDGQIIEEKSVVSFFTKPSSSLAKKYANSVIVKKMPESLRMQLKHRYEEGMAAVFQITSCSSLSNQNNALSLVHELDTSIKLLQSSCPSF